MENIVYKNGKLYLVSSDGEDINMHGILITPSGSGLSKHFIARQIKDISEEEAEEDYKELTDIDIKDITPNTKVGNKFVDYFTFKERLETKSDKDDISFYEFFDKKNHYSRKRYIKNLLNYYKQHGNKNLYKIWYGVFSLYFSSISLFKPVLAMEIYNRYKPKTVLDPTMGWGGRLVGACALDIPNYIGIDLNKQLEKPYADMVDKLKELGTKTNIKLMFTDALKVDYSKLTYDCVFTSPPYYNIETYKGSSKMKKEDWDSKFYFPLFEKTFNNLSENGKYILNIPQEVYERVCLPLFGPSEEKFPLKKQQRHNVGVSKENPYTEYIYVWTKGKTTIKPKGGAIINNPELYAKARKLADEVYDKPSAYKSGYIVKKYKELGGTYSDDKQTKPLKRWFEEEWTDIGGKEYPVYRPTKRVSKETPLTVDEIDPQHAKQQIKLKQELKEENLPKFKKLETNKQELINKYSNFTTAQKRLNKYMGEPTKLYLSDRKDKKYYIITPDNKKVHFGQMGYEDFTKHKDEARRQRYLNRATKIKGSWKEDKYSPNNLAINVLW